MYLSKMFGESLTTRHQWVGVTHTVAGSYIQWKSFMLMPMVMGPPSLVRSQAIGETAWQLLRVQPVYGCDVTAIVISCLWKQLFAVGIVWTKLIMQSAYTSAIEWLLLKWNGCDCDVSMHDAIGFYCCHVTVWNLISTATFLAGESLNSQDHFSYSLGTRLGATMRMGQTHVKKTFALPWNTMNEKTFFVEWANWH